MSWFSIAGAAVSVTGSMMSASSSRRAAERSQQNYQAGLNSLLAGAGSNVFGEVPEHVPYIPVDITQSQLDTIAGNRRAMPSIEKLVSRTNRGIVENDLTRIRRLAPGYDERVADMFSEITANMRGDTNISDFFPELIRNRAEISGAIGTPGTSNAITTRDLGLGALSLQDRGMSMFQSWLNTANQNVSPIASQMRPQEMMFTPAQRLDADMMQAQLLQQSGQAGAYLAAMPDPVAAGQFQARLGALAQTTPQAQPSMLGPIMQGAGTIIGAAGSAYDRGAARRDNYYYGTPMNSGYRPPSQYQAQSYVPNQTGYNNYGPGMSGSGISLDRPPRGFTQYQ
jgi:hypothetical protein